MDMNIKNGASEWLDGCVTDDFMWQTSSRRNKEEFLEYASSLKGKILKWNYNLSDYRIISDINYAHINFLHKDDFVTQTDSINSLNHGEYWDSLFIVKEGDKLKLNFFSSTRIKFDSKPIE